MILLFLILQQEDRPMKKEMLKTYSINQATEMTGVSKNRIRDWHDKNLLPGVQVISVGTREHRRFTQPDIELITRINGYQAQGYILSVAAKMAQKGN
jgi:DNA-binding transcriptional MerR regulator